MLMHTDGPRIKKQTLQTKYLESVRPFLTDNTTPSDQVSLIQQEIHTKAVQDAILSTPPNRVLDDAAPEISPEERTLPRAYRTTLSQLRLGHCIALSDFKAAIGRTPDCKALNSYQNRINPTIDPSCPECGSGEPHTTAHLFRCLAHPTELDVRDLWLRPDRVARFISSLPCFHYLPPLPPPPPEPPPAGAAP